MALCLVSAPSAPAQGAASTGQTFMVSDNVQFDRATQIIEARGNVEIFHEGQRLRADTVIYDGLADKVTVTGQILLQDMASGSITRAEFAELDTSLQNFLLVAVRHLMKDQLQMAAREMERRDGRYTQWRSMVASYCEVCEASQTPLWEIRARSATHDQLLQRVYFRNAQFRLAGVPIAYTPYLSIPEPGVTRATGFVRASLQTSSITGTTLRTPYFIVINDHSDLTLTPRLSLGGSQSVINTLEARYRQALAYGDLELNGAITRDTLTDAANRGYIFVNGNYAFPSGFDLSFQLQSVSDRSYLTTYNFYDGRTTTFNGNILNFDTTTLVSSINLSRIRPDEIIQLNAAVLDTLQPPTATTDHPSHLVLAEYARWFNIPGLPGNFVFSSVGQADYNEYGPTNARQRDIARVFTGLQWRESWQLGHRFVLDTEAAAFGDVYRIRDDATLPPDQTTTNTLGVVTLRWPWERTTHGGLRHTIEPFVRQIAFDGDPISVPTVDGTIDNFDPNGRFDLSRFRRIDRNRDLNSTEIGFDYMTYFPNGWAAGGRVETDYLWNTAAGQYRGGTLYTARMSYRSEGLTFDASRAFNSGFFPVSDRLTLSYTRHGLSVTTSYTRIGVDPDLATSSRTNLLSFGLAWAATEAVTVRSNLTRDIEAADASFFSSGLDLVDIGNWSSSISGNYSIDDGEFDRQDFTLSRALDWGGDVNFFYRFNRKEQRSVGLTLSYMNECVNLGSQILSRRSAINNSQSALEVSLSVEFGGFASRGRGRCG